MIWQTQTYEGSTVRVLMRPGREEDESFRARVRVPREDSFTGWE